MQVELLLNNGAPINAGLEREGGSVLHHSVKAGNVECVKTLLENKVKTYVEFHITEGCGTSATLY